MIPRGDAPRPDFGQGWEPGGEQKPWLPRDPQCYQHLGSVGNRVAAYANPAQARAAKVDMGARIVRIGNDENDDALGAKTHTTWGAGVPLRQGGGGHVPPPRIEH